MLGDQGTNSQYESLRDSVIPIWAFDSVGCRIFWANKSALEFWHALSVDHLRQRDFSSDSVSVKNRLQVILKMLEGAECLTETWTLYPKNQPVQVLLEFQRIARDAPGNGDLLIKLVERCSKPYDDASLRMLEATRTTSSMITMMTLEGRVLAQNPAALQRYGPALPETSRLTDLETRLNSSYHLRQAQEAILENLIKHLDISVQTLEGPRTHSATIQRGRDPVSGVPTILLSEDDVSEVSNLYQDQKEQAEELAKLVADRTDRLRSAKGRIDRALEVAAIWDWDIAQDKLYFSPNFMKLLGYEPEEFHQKLRKDRFQGILHPDDYFAYQPILAGFMANPDKPISHEMRFATKQGDYLWIQIEGKCFCDEAGQPIRTTGLLTNITEKKRIEATLLASQKLEAIGLLTGGIAHDFNNLLAVILGNMELLQELDTVDKTLAKEITNAVQRGSDLIRHMLAFARKQRLAPEPLELAELAIKMRQTLLRILSETITVVVDGPDDLWMVYADATQTESAILNIALNARDAMPNGGIISISAQNVSVSDDTGMRHPLTPGDYVCIAVSDTGSGMSPEVRAKAFDPFYTLKEVGKGSGLGLSMVLGFSQQSNGNAEISSEPGSGTTVSIYLPRADAEKTKSSKRTMETPLIGHGEHIHILEDNADVSATTCKIVESLGYTVSTSDTVANALLTVEQLPDIDVFIADVILPGGQSGIDFAMQVRQSQPGAKLILVSGFPEAELLRDEAQALEFMFLPKPFSRAQLSKSIAACLRRTHTNTDE